MLVLARRLHERIILPSLDVTIQVVGIQGNMTRLGIDAPQEVPIYREEVYDAQAAAPCETAIPPAVLGRNRLNNLGLSLALLQRQLPAGLTPDARQALEQVHTHYAALKAQVQALLQDQAACNRQVQLTS